MIESQELIYMLERNLTTIRKQVEGLTHEDSLLQLPFRGNCLNWTVGHIVMHRDYMLKLLGGQPVLDEVETELYATGSDPITDASQAINFETLMEHLQTTHIRVLEILQTRTGDELAIIVADDERQRSLGQMLFALGWHETYHVGQTEILRQLAGTDDRVI
ncbi:MAG: DinB family protein [Anaerolineae bacterium]